MENPFEVFRIQRSEKVLIIARIGQFMGKTYLDIREYLVGPEPYEGFTKRGIRIPIALVGGILKGIEAGLHNRLNELNKQIQQELAELIKR